MHRQATHPASGPGAPSHRLSLPPTPPGPSRGDCAVSVNQPCARYRVSGAARAGAKAPAPARTPFRRVLCRRAGQRPRVRPSSASPPDPEVKSSVGPRTSGRLSQGLHESGSRQHRPETSEGGEPCPAFPKSALAVCYQMRRRPTRRLRSGRPVPSRNVPMRGGPNGEWIRHMQ